jgi:small subunit ribosomal protein S1
MADGKLCPEVSTMSEPDKPQATPEPTPTPPQAPEPTPQQERLRRGALRPGRPPVLAQEEVFGAGARIPDMNAEIEQELQEIMGGASDQEIYGEPAQGRRPAAPAGTTPGRLKGKVIRVHAPDVFVDVPGGRSQGVLSLQQFPEGVPAPGTEVEVSIEGYDSANGLLLLSRKGAAMEADWSTVAVGMIVEARVTATNKGGLAVEINGIRGFMPISQIDLYRVEDAEQYVNQRLLCMVTEVDPDARNLVVSRRALLEREREESRDKLWAELAEGQIREGVVRSVKDFGAFVDLGGVDGLLHVSEMSWTRVLDAASVVQPGQRLKVVVLKIDRERRKVSLGAKQLTASPWDNIQERYHPGATVTGKVTRLMDFGAFVELEPAVEGLIHISELAPQRVRRVRDIVQEGQEVRVTILNVDPAQRRISLSLKAALAQVEAEEAAEAAAEEEEEQVEVKPPRPRTTPLRGGIGGAGGLGEKK